MQVLSDSSKIYRCCGRKTAMVLCDGCGMDLCIDCRLFDLWGYGCGHVDTKAFCATCFNDPVVNPFRAGDKL